MKHFFHYLQRVSNGFWPASRIFIALVLFCAASASAQTITIAGPNSDYDELNAYGPMATHATGVAWSRHGYVYPASLLQSLPGGATISSIEFNVFTEGYISGSLNCKIYLRESYVSEFVGDSSWADYSGPATLVYNSNPSSISSDPDGYKKFPLSPTFKYYGGSLMVLVEYTQSEASFDAGYWNVEGASSIPAYTNKQSKHITGSGALPANSQFATSSDKHPWLKINYAPPSLQNDLAIIGSSPASNVEVTTGTLTNLSVFVQNKGALPQSGKIVKCFVDGALLSDTAKTPNLSPNMSGSVLVGKASFSVGSHTIKYEVDATGDQNASNNSLTINITAKAAGVQNDLAITGSSPANNQEVTAGVLTNLTALVQNKGQLPQSAQALVCYIDGLVFSDTAKTPNLSAGMSGSVAVGKASFTAGSHVIKYIISPAVDEDASNDVLTINIVAKAAAIQNDLAITGASSPTSNQEVAAGTPINLSAIIKNQGAASQSSTMVRCFVDGVLIADTAKTPNLLSGQSATVVVSRFSFSAGSHSIKYEVLLSGDENTANNVLTIGITAKGPAGPTSTNLFFHNANTSTGWFANSKLWGLFYVTEPNDSAGISFGANFFNAEEGVKDTLMTPLLNLGLDSSNRPVLSYYYAHQTYTVANPEPDKLDVIVSTDGGITWSAPILSKTANGSPSLRTNLGTSQPNSFKPSQRSDWRHEQIDLSAYAKNNVRIGFVATSGYGNLLYLNNIAITQAVPIAGITTNLATQAIAATGPQPAVAGMSLNFASIVANGKAGIARHQGIPTSTSFATNSTASTHNGAIFTPNTISADYWYTVSYDGAASYSISIDISGITNAPLPQELYIMKRADQTDPWMALKTTLAGNILTASGLTSFSDFAIGSRLSSNTLPLQLLSFAGSKTSGGNTLRWSTSNETRTTSFVVEKSTDGASFSAIGEVKAIGNGNNSYTLKDNGISGTAYYRLKMLDKDGNITYSAIVRLALTLANNLQLYPNPAKNIATLQYESRKNEALNLRIINASGKTIWSKKQAVTEGTNAIGINVAGFAAGMYTITAQAGENIQTVRMIKQ